MYKSQVLIKRYTRPRPITFIKGLSVVFAFSITTWVAGVAGALILVGVCSIANLLRVWYQDQESHVVVPVSILLGLFVYQLFLDYGLEVLNATHIVARGSIETLEKYSVTPFDYSYRFNELTVFPALLMLGCLPLIAIALSFKKDRKNDSEDQRNDQFFWPALISLAPLLFLALLKQRGVLDAVVFAMSGDGRNHFVITQDIRLEGTVSLGIHDLGSPRLANGLAALISAGNGSRGTLQVGDLVGMSVVYLISIVTICTSTISLVASQISVHTHDFSRRALLLASCIVIPLIVCSSSSLGSVLADGFLSLALGSAVLSIIIVISLFSWVTPRFSYVPLQFIGLYVLAASYSFLIPPAIGLCLLTVARFSWFTFRWKGFGAFLIASIFVGGIGWKFVIATQLSNFERTTELIGGAVRDFDFRIVWLICLALLIWQLLSFKKQGLIAVPFVALGFGVVASVYLVERSANYSRNNFTYYSNKIMLAYMWVTAPILIVAVVVSIVSLFQNHQLKISKKLIRVAALLAAICLLIMGIQSLNRKAIGKNPAELANVGWAHPNVETVRPVLERWNKQFGYFVVWNLADNPPYVIYPSIWEDRVANFWSPAMWNGYRGDGFSTLWSWIYFEVNDHDVAQLCPALKAMPITVVTRDKTLESAVSVKCGKTLARYELLARPNMGPETWLSNSEFVS